MNTDAELKMAKAVIGLIRRQPFFGVLATKLIRVETSEIPTLATDSERLLYSPDWVLNNPIEVVEAGVAHEVMHCVLHHCGDSRRGGRTPQRWNHAIDYAANDILKDAGFNIPNHWLWAASFKGQAAEEIYGQLPEDPPGEPFDEHMGGTPAPDAEVSWKIATIQAANEAAKKQGTLPGALQRFIDQVQAPKVDWRTVLRRFATASARNDYSWTRPSRAYLSLGILMPGLYSEAIEDITVIVDTSGSINDEVLEAFSSEVEDIRVSARPKTTRIIYCDAEVQRVDELTPDEYLELGAYGGGGTDFRPPFTWLEREGKSPACTVYLTDGYGPFPTTPPPYPVLWVMTTDVVPPWGEHVRIEL